MDYSASLSLSFQGELWQRADDPLGMAAAAGGISKSHKNFVVAAGSGILAGDGGLSHGWEKSLETYYSCELAKRSHLTADYQFITIRPSTAIADRYRFWVPGSTGLFKTQPARLFKDRLDQA